MAKGDQGRGRGAEATEIRLGRRPTGALGAAFAAVIVGGLLGISLLLAGMMANARIEAAAAGEAGGGVTAEAAEAADGTPISMLGAVLMLGAVAGWVLLKRRVADKTLTLDDEGLALARGRQVDRARWTEVVDAVWSTRADLSETRLEDEAGPDDAWVVQLHLRDDRRLTIEGLDAWEPAQARAALRRYLDRHAPPG